MLPFDALKSWGLSSEENAPTNEHWQTVDGLLLLSQYPGVWLAAVLVAQELLNLGIVVWPVWWSRDLGFVLGWIIILRLRA